MGLLSIFQRNKQASAKPATSGRGGKSPARQAPLANTQNSADAAEAMREVRARARTRLMGATVLLLIGVIGFPLLFETQPRPIPVDLPIEIPARNAPGAVDASSRATRSVAAVSARGASASAAAGRTPESVSYDARPSAAAPASAAASAPAAARSAFATLAAALTTGAEHANDSPASVPAVASATVAQAKPSARPPASSSAAGASRPAPAPHLTLPPPTLPPPVASRPSPAAILADTAAARPSDAAPGGGRFVVQVGAFLEDAKVRETRAKVEKLGMKTYTQPVDTPTGKRTRVRVGPYATKPEADKIAARLKGDGLQAVVLAL
jgi:DedD protein